MSDPASNPPDQAADVLTGIPQPIQCPAASGGGEATAEADEATVKAFIETLARIAQSVAARNTRQEQQE